MNFKATTLIKLVALLLVMAFALSSCAAINSFINNDDNNDTGLNDSNDNGNNDSNETPDGEKPGDENPGGENPGDENPGGENPGGENPGGENPGGENPGGENPGGENPGGENPGGENPGGENPGGENPGGENPGDNSTTEPFDYDKVPEFSGDHYAIINNNKPYFTADEITDVSFESYGDLDELGRCTAAFASLGKDLFPTESRPSLSYKPTGWVQNTYPSNIVPQSNIYNRSHLISWSLAGEGNNEKNLITGTPFFNQLGMQEFENLVLDYIKETSNHVMYRVTPIFIGNELVARGVLMEGWSVEDNGEGICFNVFMYNVQPGITIDYMTGENCLTDAGNTPDGSVVATLVTNISQLTVGTKIVIVAKDADYAISTTQNTNNRVAAVITKDGNTVNIGDDTQIITLGAGITEDTYSLGVDGGYLYSASSSKNHLKTETNLSANGSWTITITADGIATIQSTGSNTRNLLKYNSQNVLFASYASTSGQQDVCIYIVNE